MQVAPQGGFIVRMGMLFERGAAKRGYRYPHIVRASIGYVGKTMPMDKVFPAWGRQRGGGFTAKKEANPASLCSAAPSKGRGVRGRSLLPSYGEGYETRTPLSPFCRIF